MKIFLAILIALLIIGGGVALWWFMSSSPTNNQTSTQGTTQETPSEPETSSSLSTFSDILGTGGAVMCSWRAPEEAAGELQVAEGTFYTDGNSRGFSEADYSIDGQASHIEGVFMDNDVYYWQTIAGSTFGFKLSNETTEDFTDELTAEEQAQAFDVRSQYQFECNPWTVDESKFELPAGIEFIEL